MEAWSRQRDGEDGDLRPQHPVQGAAQPVDVDLRICVEAGDLSGGVHPAIRAAGDEGVDRAHVALERRLELSLHGPHAGLTGIAVELGAVVGEIDAVDGHRVR